MAPLITAKTLYAGKGLDFEADLANYIRYGYVFSTPECLIMARPIDLSKGEEWLTVPGAADAWYVHFATGNRGIRWFVEQMPYFLPKLAWRRGFRGNNALRIFDTSTVINKTRRK